MDEEKSGKSANGLLGSIFPSLPKEIRYAIGGMLVFFLFQMMVYGLVYLPKAMKAFSDQFVAPTNKCWVLQKIDKQIFKINSCTGVVEKVEGELANPEQNASKPSFGAPLSPQPEAAAAEGKPATPILAKPASESPSNH